MDPMLAAKVAALRPALEQLIVKATNDPESAQEPSPDDTELMNVVREISKINSARYGIKEEFGEGWVSEQKMSYVIF